MKHRISTRALRFGTSVVTALAMTASMMVMPASAIADEAVVYNAPTNAMTVDKNLVTATAKAYAQGTADMLGVTNTTFNGSSSAGAAGAVSAAQINNMYGMYGSDANSNPNPYIYNYFYNLYAAENGLTDSDQATLWTSGGGPTGADTTINSQYGTSLGLAHRPDIIYGNGGTATAGSDGTTVYNDGQSLAAARGWGGYTQLILEIRTWTNDASKVGTLNADGNAYVLSDYYQDGDENYNPIGLSADSASTPYAFLSACVWPMAEAAQTVIDESNGTKYLRYNTPYEQATKIEQYSKAASWYVLSQLEKDGKDKKTGIIVSGADADAKTVNVVKFDYNAEANSKNMGTVIANAAQETLTDAAASIETTEVTIQNGRNTSTVDQATLADVIKCNPEVIITTSTGVADTLAAMYKDAGATMPDNVWDEQSVKLLFNTWDGARSPECLMSTGMIQGFLYPEYISQVDLLTWYMTEVVGLTTEGMAQFYGISFSNMSLAEGQQWSTDGYDAKTITNKLNAGTKWYMTNKKAVDKSNPDIAATTAFVTYWSLDYFGETKAEEDQATADEMASAIQAAKEQAAKEQAAAVAAAKKSQMAQNLAINTSTKTVKCPKGKKKLTKAKKTTKIAVTGAKGALSYAKVSGSSKLSVVKGTNGFNVKVKKGTKKGTYKIKVKAKAAASGNYKATTATVTITVFVK